MQAMQHPTRDTRRIPSRLNSSWEVFVIVLVLHSSSIVMISGRAFARSSVKCFAVHVVASSTRTLIRISDSASARNWTSFPADTLVEASSVIASKRFSIICAFSSLCVAAPLVHVVVPPFGLPPRSHDGHAAPAPAAAAPRLGLATLSQLVHAAGPPSDLFDDPSNTFSK
ncbi:hypothetical protein ON010_g1161 [Phytophthora cinnamomi]|nr:hypothetical protein ON010_g1161 [Phytophthora cinnamomi]